MKEIQLTKNAITIVAALAYNNAVKKYCNSYGKLNLIDSWYIIIGGRNAKC